MSRKLPPMPLGHLLGAAMQPHGSTSLKEAGKTAFLTPQQDQGETVRLFRIEPEPFRYNFGLERDVPVSDALFLYLKEAENVPARWVVFVVELKGKDHKHALEQLRHTIQALRDKLRTSLGKSFLAGKDLRAVIVSDRGSPPRFETAREDFQQQTGVIPYLCATGRADLRAYLDPSLKG